MATLIYNVTDLQNMNLDLAEDYELANDIDASATSGWNWNAGRGVYEGFEPVGIFTGSLDGKWFSITNLYINNLETSVKDIRIGLFRTVRTATIKNLIFIDAQVTGERTSGADTRPVVGVLAGASDRSTIEYVAVVGGAIHAEGHDTTSTVRWATLAGGLVGTSFGTAAVIRYCYTDISVSSKAHGQTIPTAGGVAGANVQSIHDCYARGSVSVFQGDHTVMRGGGLVGYMTGSVARSYSAGVVIGTGGLIGAEVGSSTVDSFWDTQTSGQATSAGGTGKTTAEMKLLSTFTDIATVGLDSPWDFTTIWAIHVEINDGYPYLLWARDHFVLLEPPEVQTLPASKITETSARLNGRVIYDGGGLCRYNFGYRLAFSGDEYTPVGWWPWFIGELATGDYFRAGISGLTADTAYEYIAGIKNASYTTWGLVRYFMTAGPGDDGDEESCYTIPDLYDDRGRVAKGSRVRAYRTDTGKLVSESTIDQYGTATLCGLPVGVDIRFIVNWGGIAQEHKSRTFFRTAAQISEGGTGGTTETTISDSLEIGATVSIWNLILGD